MCRGMSNLHELEARCYAACMIEINQYLTIFLGYNQNNKIGDMELNEILLHIISNVWGNQEFLQGFDFVAVYFKKSIDLFEIM